ncbi:uncharacterized protein LOC133898561 [Phragmites australis]|uniref:uncharacterized protein LOC133898561 n=1 Tax=Phragmites australis TaxID=29695 RepID=UPI002D768DBB|nr:uncharacterized protein LOC133898561 [Phragmites australis]
MAHKALALAFLVSAAFLLRAHQPATAQVFCRSQFNLANEACSMRTFPRPRPGLPRQQLNETSTSAAAATGGVGGQGLQSRDDDDDDDNGGRRSSRHRHRHYSEEEEDPRDTACCRRLMGLDNSCVCQAAARLPAFMNSVRHSVTLTPVDGCEVTFECPGPLF